MRNALVLMSAAILLLATSPAVAQTKNANAKEIEAKIIASERAGWKAWKDRDASWFQRNTTEDFLSINGDGVSNKTEVVKATSTDCTVKSFSLDDDFRFVMLDSDAVLLTYTVKQDAVCGGKKVPQKVRVAVNYVKRGERWLEAMYVETR